MPGEKRRLARAGGPDVPGPRPGRCPMLAGEPGVWPVDRLTDEDQRMLWPDEIWPQDIGVLAILDGSGLAGPGGRVRIEVVREVIAARLHLVPRFRQLVYAPRPGLGRPLWVDAPGPGRCGRCGCCPGWRRAGSAYSSRSTTSSATPPRAWPPSGRCWMPRPTCPPGRRSRGY